MVKSIIKPRCSRSQPARNLLQVSCFIIFPCEICYRSLLKPVLAGASTGGTTLAVSRSELRFGIPLGYSPRVISAGVKTQPPEPWTRIEQY